MHYTDRKPLHPVVQHTWAKGRTHARATEEAGSPVRVASYSRPFGTVSCEARADGDLAAARDTSGGRSAHRSISQRVWVVWDQGRPRERVGSCETPPWWPAVSSSRHVELRVPDGGDATRTRGHKATSKPRRTGAPAPRWPMRSAWRRGGSSGPARQPPVAAWGGASTRLNRDKLEREQRPRW